VILKANEDEARSSETDGQRGITCESGNSDIERFLPLPRKENLMTTGTA
jgi:hypothetical protein